MFEQNLDISLICPQVFIYFFLSYPSQLPEQTLKCSQLEKDTSLEEILDEFTKQESCPKRTSAPQGEIKKGRTLVISPTQRVPSLLLSTDPIISSSDHAK